MGKNTKFRNGTLSSYVDIVMGKRLIVSTINYLIRQMNRVNLVDSLPKLPKFYVHCMKRKYYQLITSDLYDS